MEGKTIPITNVMSAIVRRIINSFIGTQDNLRQRVPKRELPQTGVVMASETPRFCLRVLINQQLGFDCSNLCVNHAKAVQLTTASEGDVLYMIGKYFRFR